MQPCSGSRDHADLLNVGRAALSFVRTEAGFAQVTTLDSANYPVARTMTAFLNEDWSVDLIQRRRHQRLGQLERHPKLLVSWVGPPGPESANDNPNVFDLGLPVPRAVFVRGIAEFMPSKWTIERYHDRVTEQRRRGLTRAPLRSREQVAEQLVGVHVRPVRVRVEGFAADARSFAWRIGDKTND
jgi:hypothetical protein